MGKIIPTREKTVVKANELIQKSRFSLSLQQQKIVLLLISQILPYDDDFKLYEFSIPSFCRICGIDEKNGKNYKDLKSSIKDLADKSIWVKLDDGRTTLLRWIEKPYIDESSGVIQIKLDKHMRPYLLQLRKNFTKYEIPWTLDFKSKYTLRLYEIIKSIHYDERETHHFAFDLEELKGLMDATTHVEYSNFKNRALVPAVKEINEKSDKIVEFEQVKMGRAVSKIVFHIRTKDMLDRNRLWSDIENKFDLNQICLWELPEQRSGESD